MMMPLSQHLCELDVIIHGIVTHYHEFNIFFNTRPPYAINMQNEIICKNSFGFVAAKLRINALKCGFSGQLTLLS